jgi:hypothetical protein
MFRLKFNQQMDSHTHTVSQGCGKNWTCDPFVQAPECDATSPPVSPYDSFRIYSYHEISRETGSTMDINAVFSEPVVEDLTLVNGLYQPVIQNLQVSVPIVLRVIAAMGGGIVILKFPSASASTCSLTVVAYDGVYLRNTVATNDFRLVEGGRADVQVVCDTVGVHELVYSSSTLIMKLNVSDDGSGSRVALVSDSDLAAIIRPSYLPDLTGSDVEVASYYSAAFWQDNFNHSSCG